VTLKLQIFVETLRIEPVVLQRSLAEEVVVPQSVYVVDTADQRIARGVLLQLCLEIPVGVRVVVNGAGPDLGLGLALDLALAVRVGVPNQV